MSQLIYEYAVMNSGKTSKLLQKDFDYNRIGQKTLLLKPFLDTRDENMIRSRNGMEKTCVTIYTDTKLTETILKSKANVVLIDEAQFLTRNEVLELRNIVNNNNLTVICFGLKTDFMGMLFDGSKALLEQSDELNENNTFCHCGAKATMNMKFDSESGKVIKSGNQIDCGKEDKYTSVCNKHWQVDFVQI